MITETREKMRELIDGKNNQLMQINEQIEVERGKLETAKADMKAATESLNAESYSEAKTRARLAGDAIEMLTARYKQLSEREYISESESDAQIDKILEYENQLRGKYETAIVKPLEALQTLTREYKADVDDAEQTIRDWCSQIRANHRSQGTTYPDGTNRSEKAVPVHATRYTGGRKADKINLFLEEFSRE